MKPVCAAVCMHLTIVVDRLEKRWAVVEWQEMVTFSDVPLSVFPVEPVEGSKWRVHFTAPDSNHVSSIHVTPLQNIEQNMQEHDEHIDRTPGVHSAC